MEQESLAVQKVLDIFVAAEELQDTIESNAEDLFDGLHESDSALCENIQDALGKISLLVCRAAPFDLPPVTLTPSQVYLLLLQCATVLIRTSQPDKAYVIMQFLSRRYGDVVPDAEVLRGWILFCSGKTSEADQSLSAVASTSTSGDAHVIFAIVCHLRRETMRALQHVQRAMQLAQKQIDDPKGYVSAQGIRAAQFASAVQREIKNRQTKNDSSSSGSGVNQDVSSGSITEWENAFDSAEAGNLNSLTLLLLQYGASFSRTVQDYHNLNLFSETSTTSPLRVMLHEYLVTFYPALHKSVVPLEWSEWLHETVPVPPVEGSPLSSRGPPLSGTPLHHPNTSTSQYSDPLANTGSNNGGQQNQGSASANSSFGERDVGNPFVFSTPTPFRRTKSANFGTKSSPVNTNITASNPAEQNEANMPFSGAPPPGPRRASFSGLKRKPSLVMAPKPIPKKPGGDVVAAMAAVIAFMSVGALHRDNRHAEATSRLKFSSRRASIAADGSDVVHTDPQKMDEVHHQGVSSHTHNMTAAPPTTQPPQRVRFVPKPPEGTAPKVQPPPPAAAPTSSNKNTTSTTTATLRRASSLGPRPKSAPLRATSRSPSASFRKQPQQQQQQQSVPAAPTTTQAQQSNKGGSSGLGSYPTGLRVPSPVSSSHHHNTSNAANEDDYVPVTKLWKDLKSGSSQEPAAGNNPFPKGYGVSGPFRDFAKEGRFLDPYCYP